jgi:hypothetical protein
VSQPGSPNRTPLIVGGVVAGVLVLAVVAVLALSGGGGDEEKADTGTTDTTTQTGTDSSPSGVGTGAEADIRLAVETTLGAVLSGKEDVFCGGLSQRYQNAQFGGINECFEAFRNEALPPQFGADDIRVGDVEVEGDRATATLTGGEVFRLVKGRAFWEIDSVG